MRVGPVAGTCWDMLGHWGMTRWWWRVVRGHTGAVLARPPGTAAPPEIGTLLRGPMDEDEAVEMQRKSSLLVTMMPRRCS